MNKKAVYFSIDALIASSIILISVLVIYPIISSTDKQSFVQSDLIFAMSSLKIGEIENDYVKGLIDSGNITDLEKSVLEQIGEFYVFDKSLARSLALAVFEDVEVDENFGLWFEDELIASKNSTIYENSRKINVATQVISGIEEGQSVTAYSGRAFLKNSLKNDYFYFGGYVGEGNVSAIIEYHGLIRNVTMEAAVGGDFDFYVNGIYQGSYLKSSSFFNPSLYSFQTDDFVSGENLIEFVGNDLNFAGGFIKITYEPEISYESYKEYKFPGISGVINLYDSFYVPSELDEMNIYLKLNSEKNVFLKLGNTTVYRGNTTGVEEININDETLSSLIDYSSIVGKTIPLRMGLDNVSYISVGKRDADVFSVTDLSGSMTDCAEYDIDTVSYCSYEYRVLFWWIDIECPYTGSCSSNECGGGTNTRNHLIYDKEVQTCTKTLMDSAISANNIFVDIILSNPDNRAGLVGYRSIASNEDFHSLSKNNISLKNEINSWYANGGTCICCGINKAVDEIVENSEDSKFRSLIVMSDGEANYPCSRQGTGNAKMDAIQAACDAYEDHGIIVYSIGFGDGADEATLQEISLCGNGSYYYSSLDELENVYAQISEEVLLAAFYEQQLEVEGELYTRLYPESSIRFDYATPEIPYGLVTSSEKIFDNSYGGSFSVPENSQVVEARAVSYSGSRWTTDVFVNDFSVYNLTNYGMDYLDLGDPYSINLPVSLLTDSNIVNVTTGLSPENKSAGSPNNKIIYTLSSTLSAYSGLSGVASGCLWEIEFELGDFFEVSVPIGYSGFERCYYNSTNLEGSIANSQDAVQVSVLNLFRSLDYDSDGKIDVRFDEQDLEISSNELSGIPYDWSTKVQVRSWR